MSRQDAAPTMRRKHHSNSIPVTPNTPLRPDLQKYLESLNLNPIPTLTIDGALTFLRDEQNIPMKRNAVAVAFNNRELATGLFSGQRLTSQYDAMRWALAKMSVETQGQAAS